MRGTVLALLGAARPSNLRHQMKTCPAETRDPFLRSCVQQVMRGERSFRVAFAGPGNAATGGGNFQQRQQTYGVCDLQYLHHHGRFGSRRYPGRPIDTGGVLCYRRQCFQVVDFRSGKLGQRYRQRGRHKHNLCHSGEVVTRRRRRRQAPLSPRLW